MRLPLLCLCSVAGLAATSTAQVQAILFTGRFPFVSLDAPNEHPGGSITQMSEYDFSYSVPLPGAAIGRTLMPATAMQCYLGDGDANGDYLKLRTWKPSYFTNIGVDGLFVKNADRANATFDKIYWTPRTDPAAAPIEVLTAGGTPVTLVEGDWVRFLPNGNVEFFMTQAQYQVAAGPQSGAGTIGAGALVQSANGDLYFAPVDDGHWVNGNFGASVFAQDGAILKIDAANITYDPISGNVLSFAPNSARILINEAAAGPGGSLTVRQMVLNANSYDRTGVPIVTAGVYGKTGGLAFDPTNNTPGTEWTPVYPDSTGAFPPEPNLIFCSNAGSYGGTIWSTFNTGTVAVVNGTLCGSTTAGVPADGSWLGVQLDLPNFQPTLLAMTLIEFPTQPLLADMNNYGSLASNATQATWDVDFYGAPGNAVFPLITVGPQPPALVVPSIDVGLLPLAFDSNSWPDLFLTTSPLLLGFGITDAFGYASVSVPNPNNGAFAGFTIMVQGLTFQPAGLQLSSPVIVQLQ